MILATELAKHEVNWWKAHHRKQKDITITNMVELYILLYEMNAEDAKHCVQLRVEAGIMHDKAEEFEDSEDPDTSQVYWEATEGLLKSHFALLIKKSKKFIAELQLKDLKLLLDENCQSVGIEELNRLNINADDFLKNNGHKKGLDDDKLLQLATEQGFTIVTRDRGLALSALKQKIRIILVREDGWFLVEGTKIR